MCPTWVGARPNNRGKERFSHMKNTKKLVYTAAIAIALTASGCFSLSWAHNRRHVRKFIDELVQLHQDIDKVLFGLDRNPAE